ncbi:hypothetical protein DCAR_0207296 [Daucus carota subsp. sativus]|uniref:3-oxo-5-alpha-steroid 4-dehydrogenase C-terminal domain-containing protein n=1 Tax=Daucus carota subsp. sativus TaxID=79200 RepID=A0AAF1AME0_DAUCS|nr:hypothetical protein DCAR_0207296 [Daucus carota subsp. sativus]
MVLSTLLRFIYPPPASWFINSMSVITGAILLNGGLMEVKGKSMQYSKFFNTNKKNVEASGTKITELSGRNGMLVAYAPAFVASVISLAFMRDGGLRFTLLTSALTVHFFKRLFEVCNRPLQSHLLSNSSPPYNLFLVPPLSMPIDIVINISASYFLYTVTVTYSHQHLAAEFPEPVIDLKYAGTAIFLAGITGNFYHHYLLSKLRKEGEKQYKIPRGGLFDLIIGFVGISCISQTVYALSFTATRKWYLSNFEDFPKDVKALIPYVF